MIFDFCDANHDGRLTREEMIGGFEKLFRQWDVDSRGTLDAKKVADGLDKLMGGSPPF